MASIVQNEDEANEEPLTQENAEINRPKSVRLFSKTNIRIHIKNIKLLIYFHFKFILWIMMEKLLIKFQKN